MIRTDALERTYRSRDGSAVLALHPLDLTIGAGTVHGLLGRNGAGKTTLCRILSTVLLPTSGTATVAGFDVVRETRRVRQRVSIVFGGDRGLYGRLSARQNVSYWGSLHGLRGARLRDRTASLLVRFGLEGREDEPVERFSRGMKQRVHLARGLVADPPVLLLDEPTNGMDPVAALEFRDFVRDLRAEGKTILLTTHDLAEAEAVCDELTFIDAGRVLHSSPVERFADAVGDACFVESGPLPPGLAAHLEADPRIVRVTAGRAGATIVTSDRAAAEDVITRLGREGVTPAGIRPPQIHEVYLQLSQKAATRAG
ncbi:ABC transporter ATP-binding protein [Cellulomonas fimi]|uniref:ABC transporter related protein n=1 Tax=Cellulomonas fimi (strain ATCC 484 / DSM 20113 / JCM 1341 / CCUG 24087 / LMG 16345 / NBRC 15513 / NCIMB 8980 / NCTC 7547 / NRS-133) TaxID=590998 RepID=F4H6D8_CELFA|nr:ABC transporter ATP-binding protein [Cellulomonas fimi]AEE44450.1 ABC transporter related protein [Cellulomonas fimi ATCC 484]NNH06650.1 ABC transporter ATP-binding protein [Cellulomonas fimi]VEH26387.1 Daunorubicin/doxorubicin resistance ATP-binding protein DrrA [Cellulomonas fimi]